MKTLRQLILRNDSFSIYFILQSLIETIVIIISISLILNKEIIPIEDNTVLIYWELVTTWLLAVFLISILYGESFSTIKTVYKQFGVTVLFYSIILIILYFTGNIKFLTKEALIIVVISILCSVFAVRNIMINVFYLFLKIINRNRKIIIIGCNIKSKLLKNTLIKDNKKSLQFLGFFDSERPDDKYYLFDYVGKLEEVKEYCINKKVNEIYYTLPNNKSYLNELNEFADKNFIYLGIVPDLEVQERKKINAQYLESANLPIISYKYSPLQYPINWYIKRTFDIFFSLTALVFLSITIFPIIALVIKIDSKGPVFFSQLRPGRNNKLFYCYKFRTMKINHATEVQASKNDPRITRTGRFLRKTSLDELPQFLNVLLGQMSVVGPRPNLVKHLAHYSNKIPDYPLRHIVTPGITGYAQISGFRGETKELFYMEKRVEYDMMYLKNWSLIMDIKIILLTVLSFFKGDKMAY